MIGNEKLYNHVISIYLSLVDKGVNPLAALDLTNLKIAEKGWTGYATGDNKKFNNVDLFTDHLIDWHKRMYPDSLKAKNFNDFYKGIMITPKYKYNPRGNLYKLELLKTRPGVKKRINLYRSSLGLSPLTLVENKSFPIFALKGYKLPDITERSDNTKANRSQYFLNVIVKAQKGLSDILKAISDKPINYSPSTTSKPINTYNLSNDLLDNIYRSDGKKMLYKFDDLDSKLYQANRYLENRDKYGFEYSLGTINLPDLEVKPTLETWNYVDWLTKLIPNKRVRNTMAHTANTVRSSDPLLEVISRIVELYNNAGRPKMLDVTNSDVHLYGLIIDDDKYKNRANYNPITNTMYLKLGDWHYGGSYDANDFIAELSHPYLSHLQGPIKAYIGLPGDIKIGGRKGYLRKGHFEYNAHTLVEPLLYSYIKGNSALSHPKNINLLDEKLKERLNEK